MSTWVTLKMKVAESAYPRLEAFLADKLPAVRGFDGALSVSLFYNTDTRDFLILEEWVSQAHHQAYIKSIMDNGIMNQLLSFMEGQPAVTYHDRLVM
ncbi:MAG: antibiotic biosynthesis monooxygenase [Roseibium sp.]